MSAGEWRRLDGCESTQDALWAAPPEVRGVYTGAQRGGRGRLGRAWVSPEGACLCLSWRPDLSGLAPERLPRLSLVGGLAVARLVRGVCAGSEGRAREVALKWPNDLLWRGRKLAGVLCEARVRGEGGAQGGGLGVVVGIGLNLRPHPALPPTATTLLELLEPTLEPTLEPILDQLAHALAQELESALKLLTAAPATLHAEWLSHALPLGTPMRCMGAEGAFAGLGEEGGLTLDTARGRVTMESGEAEVMAHLPPL